MIISIASGKGGTGKTLVATSLALSLAGKERVQLLDCDVEEPNAHIFVKAVLNHKESVFIPIPKVDENKCTYCGKCAEVCIYNAVAVFKNKVLVFPELCHGCGACSYLCPESAISEEYREVGIVETGNSKGMDFVHGKLNIGEAMPTPVIRKVKSYINSEMTAIVDISPGTSCPVVEAVKQSDFCLLVTEPTPFGLNDLILAVEMVKKLGIPHGVVINRAGVGDTKLDEYCRKENIPILLTIPLDSRIAILYSRGITLVEGMSQWKNNFLRALVKIREIAHERACST
ncbi:MAG: ATP-binding protein [Chloroflexi bacterium]|nr:ATP-binding protein [Chloroflexota bacterium]MBL7061564.1 ATP-binding protein [Dehalococcoidia bacterium]